MTYCKLCGVNKEITGYCKCNDGSRENHLAILVEDAGVLVMRLQGELTRLREAVTRYAECKTTVHWEAVLSELRSTSAPNTPEKP